MAECGEVSPLGCFHVMVWQEPYYTDCGEAFISRLVAPPRSNTLGHPSCVVTAETEMDASIEEGAHKNISLYPKGPHNIPGDGEFVLG